MSNKRGKKWITKIICRTYDVGHYHYDINNVDSAMLFRIHKQHVKPDELQYRCIRFRCHENKVHHDHYKIRIVNLYYKTKRSLPRYNVTISIFNGMFKLKLIRKQNVLDLIKMLESPDQESAILAHDMLIKLKIL